MKDKTTKVITCVKVPQSSDPNYYRACIYEFAGDPPIAKFVEDLGVGSCFYEGLVEIAKNRSKELNLLFIPGVSMGSSIDVVFKHLFADKKAPAA